MSNDDLNAETNDSPFMRREKDETVDKNGVKWTTLYLNNNDWSSHKKFERWIVNDGVRA